MDNSFSSIKLIYSFCFIKYDREWSKFILFPFILYFNNCVQVTTTFVGEESLSKADITLLYRFSDKYGNPVSGTYRGQKREYRCDYSLFQKQRQKIQEDLNSMNSQLQNYEQIRSSEMAAAVLSFEEEWFGCLQLLKGFVTSSSKVQVRNTTLCSSGRYTEGYI